VPASGFSFGAPDAADVAAPSSSAALSGFSVGGKSEAVLPPLALGGIGNATAGPSAAKNSVQTPVVAISGSAALTSSATTPSVAANVIGSTSAATTAAAVVAAATPVPSDIRNLNLDEVMNKWSEEIDDLSIQFSSAAALVSKWDRSIVANEKAISDLWRDTQSCSVAHSELSSNLDTILGQQRDLHLMLDALEREMDDVDRKHVNAPSSSSHGGSSAVAADIERESMHQLAGEVMGELDAMSLSIRDLVVELNKTGAGDNAGDMVSQVVAVLNAHLDSLQYLDESSSQLQKRLADVSRACEAVSRDSRAYPRRSIGGAGFY
jgi:nuclear pore complex protein Nup62